jgi:putative MFS transporter
LKRRVARRGRSSDGIHRKGSAGDKRPAAGAEACSRNATTDVAAIFKPPILQRLLVGCWVLITINTLIFGFVIFLPQFFLRRGSRSPTRSATRRAGRCSLVGCAFGAVLSDYIGGAGALSGIVSHHRRRLGLFALQRRSDPVIVLSVGAILIVAIYIQTAILFGVYTPNSFRPRSVCARTASATRWAAEPRWCLLSSSAI